MYQYNPFKDIFYFLAVAIGLAAIALTLVSCGQHVHHNISSCGINGDTIYCSDGSSYQVPAGEKGDKGDSGDSIVGPQGPVGTSVTWVQFCPGATVYPSKFIEGGFCIANKLYAVYSINNGFLVYLPPGNYSSNAMNSSCSFTVAANCSVSY